MRPHLLSRPILCAAMLVVPALLPASFTGLSMRGGIWVWLCLCLFFALSALLLLRERTPTALLFPLLLAVGAALLLRLFLFDHQTADYRDFLSPWVAFFREKGGFAALGEPVGNYNIPYLCFLALISYLDLPDLYAIKLFSVLFDLLLAWGGLRLARLADRKSRPWLPPVVFCALLLLPTVVLNGACWGQCDSIYTALLLHALACVLEEKPAASLWLLAAAFSFKLQAIFLLPLWGAFWLIGRVKLRHLLLFPIGFALFISPALLAGRPLSDVLSIYLGQMGVNNTLSFNAPSVYQLIPYGMEVNASLLARLGILAAFVLVSAVLALLFRRRSSLTHDDFLLAALVLTLGVPFFLPYMHERYFFPADTLALIHAAGHPTRLPRAAAVEAASLLGYCTYLTSRFPVPLSLGKWVFPMGLEATLMLLTLLSCLFCLFRKQNGKFPLDFFK